MDRIGNEEVRKRTGIVRELPNRVDQRILNCTKCRIAEPEAWVP